MKGPGLAISRVILGLASGFVCGTLFMLARANLHEKGPPAPAPTAVPAEPRPSPAALPAEAADAEAPLEPEPPPPYLDVVAQTLEEQRAVLLTNMRNQLGLNDAQITRIQAIFSGSHTLGQGDPQVTRHPMTRADCRAIRAQAKDIHAGDPHCGAPNMVSIFDPDRNESPSDAKVCIDQFEFPNIPCEYPVVWVRANEAAELCEAEGKRLCDAHEWEGACAGAVYPPETEYTFGERRLMQEYLHNKTRKLVWAYGKEKNHLLCATTSQKSSGCQAPGFNACGSNTFPAGAFPKCKSVFGVYDQHGNAAEHMNLPLTAAELGSTGNYGETEMKGSWFIFASEEAHADDCRWRGLAWHATKIRDPDSHRNYHLGFRCCKDLRRSPADGGVAGAPGEAPEQPSAGPR